MGSRAEARNRTKACVTFILSPDVFGVERPLKQPKMAAAEVERILNAKSSHEWAVKEVYKKLVSDWFKCTGGHDLKHSYHVLAISLVSRPSWRGKVHGLG